MRSVDLTTFGEGVCLSAYTDLEGDKLFFGGKVVGVLDGDRPDLGDTDDVTDAGSVVITLIGDCPLPVMEPVSDMTLAWLA